MGVAAARSPRRACPTSTAEVACSSCLPPCQGSRCGDRLRWSEGYVFVGRGSSIGKATEREDLGHHERRHLSDATALQSQDLESLRHIGVPLLIETISGVGCLPVCPQRDVAMNGLGRERRDDVTTAPPRPVRWHRERRVLCEHRHERLDISSFPRVDVADAEQRDKEDVPGEIVERMVQEPTWPASRASQYPVTRRTGSPRRRGT